MRALKRAAKDRAFADRAFSRAQEIFTVRYLQGHNDWPLWPKSLNKSVFVGILLNAIEEKIGEERLLEMRPEELDAVEFNCQLPAARHFLRRVLSPTDQAFLNSEKVRRGRRRTGRWRLVEESFPLKLVPCCRRPFPPLVLKEA